MAIAHFNRPTSSSDHLESSPETEGDSDRPGTFVLRLVDLPSSVIL